MPLTKKQQQQQQPQQKPLINEVRIVQLPTMEMANNALFTKKHKIQTVLDVNNPKRIKSSNGLTVNGRMATATATTTASMTKTNQRQSERSPHEQQQQQQQKQRSELNKTAAPQLLQQLMAPMPYRARGGDGSRDTMAGGKWSNGGVAIDGSPLGGNAKTASLPTSHSVLKNLLVSGCDVSAGYICTVPMPIHQKKVARA